jgi:anti-anti-sigma factor
VRPEGRIFFANVESVVEQIRVLIARHRPRALALDMSRVPDIEYSALRLLLDLDRRAVAQGIDWWLVALNPEVLQVVTRCGLAERLGRERTQFNAGTAIERFIARAPTPAHTAAGPHQAEQRASAPIDEVAHAGTTGANDE